MPKRTATQRHIDNINNYIDKVGQYFGTESPEYNKILATIHNAGLSTYQSSKGIVKVSNTKANRKKHQKIRSIDKNKPSFARQKRRYEKEKKEIRDAIGINGIGDNIGIDAGLDGVGGGDDIGGGGGKPVISFDDWYNGWRETWENKEQYETRDLAKSLGVPFDIDTWYVDYAYREQIKHDLYNAWIADIVNEVNENKNLNPNVGNIDETTGENIVFGNVNEGTETEME